VLSRDAFDKIKESPIEELIVTDTIPVDNNKGSKIKNYFSGEAFSGSHKQKS